MADRVSAPKAFVCEKVCVKLQVCLSIENTAHMQQRLTAARAVVCRELLHERRANGHWVGELSDSALATATAIAALALFGRANNSQRWHGQIERGLQWLAMNQNADGGWGDSPRSLSNVSTTALAWAAFGFLEGADERHRSAVNGAERWLSSHCGGDDLPRALIPAVVRRYGADFTFSAPILTMCALSGRLGEGAQPWQHVAQLPFELAALPRSWFGALRLRVVSYALPALIAIGQARHFHLPSSNPLLRALRNLTRARTLRILRQIQPSNGGFLEATPLTSFVAMSLAGCGQANHPVTVRAVEFLTSAQRMNGSWPIDTNLATWLTTLSITALSNARATSDESSERLLVSEVESALGQNALRDWLLKQQFFARHFYSDAEPGGWAWTDLPGGVPDADDTASALLALNALDLSDAHATDHVWTGLQWLMDLQNDDGGIPTFCRGWGKLPFDRSAPDLTANAIRAWLAWYHDAPVTLQNVLHKSLNRAFKYLAKNQRANGSWIPLWFGNQFAPEETNAIYGTARVLLALSDFAAFRERIPPLLGTLLEHGIEFLISTQHKDGSWSAAAGQPGSIEETALATEALAACHESCEFPRQWVKAPLQKASSWLIDKVESGEWKQASPIGLYFARLWYDEKLYPQIFAAAALNRVANLKLFATENPIAPAQRPESNL